MSSFCITLEAHPPEASYAPAGHVGHSTHGERVAQVLLEAQGACTAHPRCSGHKDQREKPEVRRELVPRGARKAPPYLECRRVSRADGPGWEDGAQWPYAGFVPQVSVPRKSCNFFQYGLPLLTGEAEVPDVCVVSACEGCWLKFLYFMSFPYWRKWPGLAPQAAALSYRRRARCRSWWLPGGSQRSAAADNRRPPWWTGRSRLIASGIFHWQKLPFAPKSSQISSVPRHRKSIITSSTRLAVRYGAGDLYTALQSSSRK